MQTKIENLLRENTKLKGAQIANKLGLDKTLVNSFLYKNGVLFTKDEEHFWSLALPENLTIVFDESWVDCKSFEDALSKTTSPWDSDISAITFLVREKCSIMLDAAARLLALCNQLVLAGKNITIDFSNSKSAFTYFDRIGFLQQLDKKVNVKPRRPLISLLASYTGRNNAVVEFGAIDPTTSNKKLIEQLIESFVAQTDDRYRMAAVTIFSELINNIEEHSQTQIPGFCALQKYGGRTRHIQTVVSDSGKGIAQTIRPSLKRHYPDLYERYCEENLESDMGLVITALERGQISRHGSQTGRGLGLKMSQEQALKFNAKISVRQETYALLLNYRDGNLINVDKKPNLVKIPGTHICFDFLVV